jgi:hypothetical protein
MTAQTPETLHYEGEQLSMCTEPLGDFFKLAGLKPQRGIVSTALWRGYVGEWEIIDDRLYLIGINGELDGIDVNLETFFPGYPDRVFAHWFSGTIRAPQGRLLKYVHGGYGSIYERDLLMKIEKGVVRETTIRENEDSEISRTPNLFKRITLSFQGSPLKATAVNPPVDKEFHVQREELLRQMTMEEIEKVERVLDPLGSVPDLPFGHLHPTWERFRAALKPEYVVWAFAARWPRKQYGRHLAGYVAVDDNAIGSHFLCTPIE